MLDDLVIVPPAWKKEGRAHTWKSNVFRRNITNFAEIRVEGALVAAVGISLTEGSFFFSAQYNKYNKALMAAISPRRICKFRCCKLRGVP